LKVFILAGQSNMLGYGIVSEKDKSGHELKGTLAWMLKDPAKAPLITHLFDAQGAPAVREDVWVDNVGRFPNPNRGALRLGYGCNDENFGPELGFGMVLGDASLNQVLIIKTAWGGRSLYKDFRPPSSGGTVGPTYLQMIKAIKESLANLKTRFPSYDGGEYELSGFVWWHGWNDHIDACNHEYERGPAEYEQNLANLVHDVRNDLGAPNLPFVIGEFLGPYGRGCASVHPHANTIRKAQAAVAARPEFHGTVAFVPTHDLGVPKEESPGPWEPHHEFRSAETYYLVGEALGKAMKTLLAGGARAADQPTASLPSIAASLSPVDMRKRAEELKSLKWGMFICWSFSTFSGKEWTPGVKDAAFFKATGCDTDQWARTAKEAGMGYILFLTKHHDGFCLWDTKTTDRKVTKAPLGRDVLAELRKSCDKYGIKLALYFSEGDWTFPAARDGQGGGTGQAPETVKAQLKELCTLYGPIEFFWMDCAAGHSGITHKELNAWVKGFQPGCFVGCNGGRPGDGTDLRAGEMAHPGPVKDFLVGEFTYPILPPHEGGAMWFYSLPKHDTLCIPAATIYREYHGAVKHGNIFSLDVGPDYAGKLRAIDVETLRKVGEMIRTPPPDPPPALSEGKSARASSTWGPGYEADKAFDGDESTRWGAAPNSRSGWLEVDLGKETRIGRAVIMELGYHRTQEFIIEFKQGDVWKELRRGTTIAGPRVFDFPPLTARYVRLNILKASEVPTIEEFQIFGPTK
jgi:alpha-L-fucosidase